MGLTTGDPVRFELGSGALSAFDTYKHVFIGYQYCFPTHLQWPLQVPKLEVPTIYEVYIRAM